MREPEHINFSAKDNKGDIMPTIELLQKLKAMPDDEAIEKSRINLQNSNIIEPNGDFTERYHYSRKYTKSKE